MTPATTPTPSTAPTPQTAPTPRTTQITQPARTTQTTRTTPPALVLVPHGSRDPRALTTIQALAARVRALRPALAVHLGHIELNAPLLPDTLARLGDAEAVLVPLLLSRGHHIKRDIPEMAAASPARTTIAAPLGPHPLLAQALHTRLTEAGWPTRMTDQDRRTSAVVLAAAGSRDPDAALDTAHTARLLATRLGVPVLPAYASAAHPTLPEAIDTLRRAGRPRIAIASYFTAPGLFATQCAAQAPWLASHPLGPHPALPHLLLTRYKNAHQTPRAPTAPLQGRGELREQPPTTRTRDTPAPGRRMGESPPPPPPHIPVLSMPWKA